MSKLYATATSEKASKGQGGNEYIEIDIRDASQSIIFSVRAYPKKDDFGEYIDIRVKWAEHIYMNGHHGLNAEITTKGEKQKGETCLMGLACAKNGNCDNPSHNK